MVFPSFIGVTNNARVLKLQQYVLEVMGEAFAKQTAHVLKHKGTRAHLSHNTDSLGKHVPLVTMALVLAAQGKWLARRAPGNKVNLPSELAEIQQANVLLYDRPVSQKGDTRIAVGKKRVARVAVPFHNGCVPETRA